MAVAHIRRRRAELPDSQETRAGRPGGVEVATEVEDIVLSISCYGLGLPYDRR